MKTSNKILIGLITFIGICCFCFLIYAKSNVEKTDQSKELEETGQIIKMDHDVFGIA